MEERCEKHGLLIGQCSICGPRATKDNQGKASGGLTPEDMENLKEYGRGIETTKKRSAEEAKVKEDFMEEVQMKVCSKCGGDPKPITEFHKNHLAKDGYAGICKKCKAKISKDYNLSKKKKKKKKDVPTKKPKAGVKSPKVDPHPAIPVVVQLDVTDYPEILESLKIAAKKSIRTIEHQATMLVRLGLMKDGYLIEKEAKEPVGR